MIARQDFRFLERLRVRWAEVDMQKIVFNGHYLMYFDTAVAGYWRAMAMPYAETMLALEGDIYVRKATLEYLGSARYDDQIDVGVRCRKFGNSSIVFDAGVFRGETLLVGGELLYVFADPAAQTSKPVPTALREAMLGYEAGDSMLRVETGRWADLGAAAQLLRRTVFIDEQGIPAELDHDGSDAVAVHAVAYNRLGLALGTGRIVEAAPGVVKLGRMAVRADMRGAGVGRALLDALVAAARAQGQREVMLHAQRSAEGFYLRAGFALRGEPFEEAGRAHVEMVLVL